MIRRLTRTLRVADGTMRTYVARPDAGSAPALVVLHGAAGLDEVARNCCDALAALGYLAVCPDLLGCRGDGHASDGERCQALGGARRFDPARGAGEVRETVDAIRRETLDHANIAVIGRGPDGLLAELAGGGGRLGAAMLAIDINALLDEPGTGPSDQRIGRLLERWLGPGIARTP
ncbi:MAG TPA: dienelactone hydrolase family protein [Candidatus Saccharimonadia bacterium]|nr:dienelactone hydrolase family protein [Candidatus Saccharimonadia bacterium]